MIVAMPEGAMGVEMTMVWGDVAYACGGVSWLLLVGWGNASKLVIASASEVPAALVRVMRV